MPHIYLASFEFPLTQHTKRETFAASSQYTISQVGAWRQFVLIKYLNRPNRNAKDNRPLSWAYQSTGGNIEEPLRTIHDLYAADEVVARLFVDEMELT